MSTRLSELTTLRLGGPIATLHVARTSAELVDAVRHVDLAAAGGADLAAGGADLAASGGADLAGAGLLLVGGGSNLVAADEGWPGTVVLIRTRGVAVQQDGADVLLTVAAGEPWDDLVQHTVEQGWSGLETMSGIPGLCGATPVQNVGAYGAEIADVLESAEIYDRETGESGTWTPAACGFGFRTSAFKHTDRFVVVELTIRLAKRATSIPIRYAELARRLGVESGATASTAKVRETVLALRRSKGMVADGADHDSWSVGSFFVNPLVDVVPTAAKDCPHWSTDGAVKLSAAWLIERAGYPRGYGNGRVGVSTKHTLALTNRGGATTAELLALAHEIQAGVAGRFGIRLRPEARLAPNIPPL